MSAAASGVAAAPPLAWQGAERLAVLCNVAGGPGVDHVALGGDLCRQVVGLAASGAPVPVQAISYGDPAITAPKAVVLLVHAAIEDAGGSRRLLLTMRAVRPGAGGDDSQFGSTPRSAALPASGLGGAALPAALQAALDETLPWRAGPAPRRIR